MSCFVAMVESLWDEHRFEVQHYPDGKYRWILRDNQNQMRCRGWRVFHSPWSAESDINSVRAVLAGVTISHHVKGLVVELDQHNMYRWRYVDIHDKPRLRSIRSWKDALGCRIHAVKTLGLMLDKNIPIEVYEKNA